jgi:hypothetical protein
LGENIKSSREKGGKCEKREERGKRKGEVKW